jgi:preprotein translocase subunit SecG
VGLNRRTGAYHFFKARFLMGLFQFLIVVQGIIAASLVGVILMQRSEGGGLGGGGSPAGLVSARGAADLLTRTTAILATLFILLSITLAFVAARQGSAGGVDVEAAKSAVTTPARPAPAPASGDAAAIVSPPAKTEPGNDVPLDK